MTQDPPAAEGVERVVKNGRIRQSLALWCLDSTEWAWDLERVCRLARDLGCPSVELVLPADWGTVQKHGLECALALATSGGMPWTPRAARGHPGYQGDDMDYCAEIVRRVGSPNVKLLFDIYHVQVMNGDVIRSGDLPRPSPSVTCNSTTAEKGGDRG